MRENKQPPHLVLWPVWLDLMVSPLIHTQVLYVYWKDIFIATGYQDSYVRLGACDLRSEETPRSQDER